jgi:hypothetical protein
MIERQAERRRNATTVLLLAPRRGDVLILDRRQAGGSAAGYVGDGQLNRQRRAIGFFNRQPHGDRAIGIDRKRLLQDVEIEFLHGESNLFR